MSERNFAFLACPADLDDPAPAIDWLLQFVRAQGAKGAARFVAVGTKFKAPQGIRTFNVEADYPVELAQLLTHAHWTRSGQSFPQPYRDALALFCLQRFMQAHPDVTRIVLISGPPAEGYNLAPLLQTAPSRPFHWLERDETKSATTSSVPILFDRASPDFDVALQLALDLALTGAIYGFSPYRFEAFLDQTASAATVLVPHLVAGENGLKS